MTTLPVPQLQLPQPPAAKTGKGQHIFKNVAAGSNSFCSYGNTVQPSFIQRSGGFPSSISVQNFGTQQFPSAAESAALNFTRSLDVRSSQKAASNLKIMESSKTDSGFDGSGAGFMKTSQSIPASVNFVASGSVARPEKVANDSSSHTFIASGVDSSASEDLKKSASGDNASAVFGASLENSCKERKNLKQTNLPQKNSLDFLLDLSGPSSSSEVQNTRLTDKQELKSTANLNRVSDVTASLKDAPEAVGNDEFGDLSVAEGTLEIKDDIASKPSHLHQKSTSSGEGIFFTKLLLFESFKLWF